MRRQRPPLPGQPAISGREPIAVTERLSNRVVDPLVLERNISHEFFRALLREAARVVELEELSNVCRDRLKDIRHVAQAVAAQMVANASLTSAVNTERLNKQMVWMSVLVAILAVAQFVVAFRH